MILSIGFMLFLYIVGQVKTIFDAIRMGGPSERMPEWSYTLVDTLNNCLPRYKDLDKLTSKLIAEGTLTQGEIRMSQDRDAAIAVVDRHVRRVADLHRPDARDFLLALQQARLLSLGEPAMREPAGASLLRSAHAPGSPIQTLAPSALRTSASSIRSKRTRSPTRSGKKPVATSTMVSGVRPMRFHPPGLGLRVDRGLPAGDADAPRLDAQARARQPPHAAQLSREIAQIRKPRHEPDRVDREVGRGVQADHIVGR